MKRHRIKLFLRNIKKYKLYALLLTAFFTQSLMANSTDSLIYVLQQTMKHNQHYMEAWQNNIDTKKRKLKLPVDAELEYRLNYEIANLYLGFQYDSAYVYGKRCLAIAHKTKEKELCRQAEILYADILSSAGLFVEAKEILDRMEKAPSFDYYTACERFYGNLCDYHSGSRLEEEYRHSLQETYRKIFRLLDPSDTYYYLYAYRIYAQSRQWKKALEMAREYVKLTKPGTQRHAVAQSCMSEAYKQSGDENESRNCLIRSAISDIVSATKENRSLFELALLLYEENAVEQAYECMLFALEDANFYNTRLRNVQISRSFPLIENAYRKITTEYARKLSVTIISILLLCLTMAGIIIKLRKKEKRICTLQAELQEQNSHLKHLTDEQQKLISLQASLNKEIECRNKELLRLTDNYKKANRLKEEYLGHFLQLCATHISKLNDYRKLINRKLVAGQYKELVSFTSSSKSIITEKDALYKQFDEAFLKLYPNFADQLNELLQPEYQIKHVAGEGMSVEMRMCALLRLGIHNSSDLADFLGYTPSTLYTYRTKMRNRAIDRDNFESDVMNLR